MKELLEIMEKMTLALELDLMLLEMEAKVGMMDGVKLKNGK